MIARIRTKKFIGLVISVIALAILGWRVNEGLIQNGTALSMLRRVSPLERTEAWREDLNFLANRMPQLHPNLFFSVSEQEFEEAVSQLEAKIPHLTDDEIVVEFMKLAALVSYEEGRDGHTYVNPFGTTGFRAFPLRLYQFSDGWFVVDAQEPYVDLIGARLVQIADADMDEVYATMEPLVSRDNEMGVRAKIAQYFLSPELLQATGITHTAEYADFVLEDTDNQIFTVEMRPIAGDDYEVWRSSGDQQENFMFEYLEDSHTIYIQYNAVRATTQSGETLKEFGKRIEGFVSEHDVDRTVVDIRQNGGGDNTTYGPLLALLSENEAINQPGALFIITGRVTFSAAGNFATDMKQNTQALFAGEPMAGGLNQYGDNLPLILPNSGLEVRISSRYWQFSNPDDERLTISPDILVEVSSEDFFANRDPVMEAILSYK